MNNKNNIYFRIARVGNFCKEMTIFIKSDVLVTTWDRLKKPQKIQKIKQMPSAIVVGGGLAGLSAAHTLLENGIHVTMLDKNPFLGGNSTKATSGINGANTKTQGVQGVEDSVDSFLEDIVRSATGVKTGPMPEPYPLARVIAGESTGAVHWIQDSFGVPLDVVSRMGGHSNQRCHRTLAGGKFPGMEITSSLMKKFEAMCDAEDGTCDLIINASARKLLKDNQGRVVGVEYTDGDGLLQRIEASAVILATGGYGAGGAVNGSLLHKVRPDLVHLPTTNGDHSIGEGIQLALDIGAKAIGLQHVQVHPTGLVNPSDPNNRTKFLAAEALRGEGGIIVDCEGKRFCNDIGKRDYVTGRMWELGKAPYRLILNTKASSKMQWHCKHYCSRRVMKHFKNAAEVAKEIGITTSAMKASLDSYNADAAAGANGTPDRFGKIYFLNAPFEMDEDYYVSFLFVCLFVFSATSISSITCITCTVPPVPPVPDRIQTDKLHFFRHFFPSFFPLTFARWKQKYTHNRSLK